LGTHLNAEQFQQLCDRPRIVYLTFDVDANGSGQQASQQLAQRLRAQGITARRVLLPDGHDPNSFFVQGGDAGKTPSSGDVFSTQPSVFFLSLLTTRSNDKICTLGRL
jgi:DNA primase